MKTAWQTYQALELLPDSAPEPKANLFLNALLLNRLWRGLLNALAKEHFYEQRREYFERCWAIDDADPYTTQHTDPLEKLLLLD